MEKKEGRVLDNWADMIQGKIDEEEAKVFSPTVLEEAHNPNYGPMEDPDVELERTGTCGDSVRYYIRMDGDRVAEATFITDGCGATLACNSMVTKMVRGMTVNEVLSLTDNDLLSALGGLPDENLHCATLAVGTLRDTVIRIKRRAGT